MIRWKYFIPTLIFIGSLFLFFTLFFDPLVSRGLEKVGSRMNGARVNIKGFHTRIFKGRVEIGNIQVANKEEPMQNSFEAGPLSFQISPMELIRKKILIQEAQLKGLALGTPRKTSGALPKPLLREKVNSSPSASEKITEKYKDQFKFTLDGLKADSKAKIEFDPQQLELVKKADELSEEITDVPAQWDKSIEDLSIESRLQKIDEDLKSIKSTPTQGTEALKAVPEALKKLNQSKEELAALKKEVQEARETAQQQWSDIKNAPQSLAQAKRQDLNDLLSRFNLDFANPEKLIQGILGKSLLTQLQTALHYVELARRYMPSSSEKQKTPPPPRFRGIDISFPTPAAPPSFWMIKAVLEGRLGDIVAGGQLTHLTSNPTRVGKPCQFNLDGREGAQTVSAVGVFDHVGESSKDSLSVKLTGWNVPSFTGGAPHFLSGGTVDVNLLLSLIGETNIGGDIRLTFHQLKMNRELLSTAAGVTDGASSNKEDQLKVRLLSDITSAIEKTPSVELVAQVYGTWADPSLKFSSNLTSLLNDVIKKSMGGLVQEQRQDLENKLNQMVKEKTAALQVKAAPLEEKLKGQFGDVEKKIEAKLNEAAGVNLGGGDSGPLSKPDLPQLKKLFKK